MPAATVPPVNGDAIQRQCRRIVVAGASGTIGRAVVNAALADGHDVIALVRETSDAWVALSGARVVEADLQERDSLCAILGDYGAQTVISCLASRSGAPKDAEAVDFRANLNLLKAAEASSTDHFILLSAICVQRPLLAFQHAKIAFERVLKASEIDHTIVQPTAFFKSLSGQVDRVLAGKPFLLFGDGTLTRCKPISDADLSRFILDCVALPERRGVTIPIGGPGPAITLKEQGELLFKASGMEPRFQSVPVGMFSIAASILSIGERFSDWFAEKAEYARIARYYATQSMLLLDPITGEYSAKATPEFGSDTLLEHYQTLIAERRGAAS